MQWYHGVHPFANYLVLSLKLNDFICYFFYPEKDTTASEPIFLSVGTNTTSTEKNSYHTDNKVQQSNTVNDNIILCITLFGCVDILLICTYSALCIYDRQHRTLGKVNTNESVPGNNSTYENAEIFFLSPTGNQLLSF